MRAKGNEKLIQTQGFIPRKQPPVGLAVGCDSL